ncbi:MAG: hypothetical protein JWQ34_2103 [Mucilaginibacter sp.]|uniref:hypothetical protein n=1 Tax=Mucilaginibacter sp. TaxID=1882438 RepID=UPI002624AAC6|nr:hypothetical protein [Mucilaginibacter sp.]MDB5003878.1 hypothetical protein [Mucilaginibacter sp.]
MKSLLENRYVFETTVRNDHSNVYGLKLEDYFLSKKKRIAPEILRCTSWDKIEFNFNGPFARINPVVDNGVFVSPEMIFYRQAGRDFYGEDVETGKPIKATLFGPTDENGIVIPVYVELKIARSRFNNINVFNYPPFGVIENWDAAIDAKWNSVGELVRTYHL